VYTAESILGHPYPAFLPAELGGVAYRPAAGIERLPWNLLKTDRLTQFT
jgi:hypothetical protein